MDSSCEQATRGLLSRGYEHSNTFLTLLVGCLSYASPIGPHAAKCLSCLVVDSHDSLNNTTFATIRVTDLVQLQLTRKVLFKQRLFTQLLPDLLNNYRSAEVATKQNYIGGLINLMQHIPRPALVSEIATVSALWQELTLQALPLMIDALSSTNAEIKENDLKLIATLISPDDDSALNTIAGNLGALIPALLDACEYRLSLVVIRNVTYLLSEFVARHCNV